MIMVAVSVANFKSENHTSLIKVRVCFESEIRSEPYSEMRRISDSAHSIAGLNITGRDRARHHAPVPVFPAAIAREPERGTNRLAPSDAARRDDPSILGRHLFLAATRPARAEKCRA